MYVALRRRRAPRHQNGASAGVSVDQDAVIPVRFPCLAGVRAGELDRLGEAEVAVAGVEQHDDPIALPGWKHHNVEVGVVVHVEKDGPFGERPSVPPPVPIGRGEAVAIGR